MSDEDWALEDDLRRLEDRVLGLEDFARLFAQGLKGLTTDPERLSRDELVKRLDRLDQVATLVLGRL